MLRWEVAEVLEVPGLEVHNLVTHLRAGGGTCCTVLRLRAQTVIKAPLDFVLGIVATCARVRVHVGVRWLGA